MKTMIIPVSTDSDFWKQVPDEFKNAIIEALFNKILIHDKHKLPFEIDSDRTAEVYDADNKQLFSCDQPFAQWFVSFAPIYHKQWRKELTEELKDGDVREFAQEMLDADVNKDFGY